MWKNPLRSAWNGLLELEQAEYLNTIAETCRAYAKTRLSGALLCLESVTDGRTLLVQLDFTGQNNHPSAIIGLGNKVESFCAHCLLFEPFFSDQTWPVLQDGLSIDEFQRFLETCLCFSHYSRFWPRLGRSPRRGRLQQRTQIQSNLLWMVCTHWCRASKEYRCHNCFPRSVLQAIESWQIFGVSTSGSSLRSWYR